MENNHMNLEFIQKLADLVADKNLGEITVQNGDSTITVKGKKAAAQTVVESLPVAAAASRSGCGCTCSRSQSSCSGWQVRKSSDCRHVLCSLCSRPAAIRQGWRPNQKGRCAVYHRIHEAHERGSERNRRHCCGNSGRKRRSC